MRDYAKNLPGERCTISNHGMACMMHWEISFLLSKIATAINCWGHTKLSESFALKGTNYDTLFRTCNAMIGSVTTLTANGSKVRTDNSQFEQIENYFPILWYCDRTEAVMLGCSDILNLNQHFIILCWLHD